MTYLPNCHLFQPRVHSSAARCPRQILALCALVGQVGQVGQSMAETNEINSGNTQGKRATGSHGRAAVISPPHKECCNPARGHQANSWTLLAGRRNNMEKNIGKYRNHEDFDGLERLESGMDVRCYDNMATCGHFLEAVLVR